MARNLLSVRQVGGTCLTERRSLGENLVNDRQIPCSGHVRLHTEARM